ncbi:hypothetical protein [Sphingobium sp. D43FB]|uniref:hypothetical protein n=1 Tax=Sphingobium sp. D43FB TaxID=2017595 RepID=UPI000BB55B5D|nr:hypothetical protein [Sphingobium sp. D43FB]PBN43555.1 hypothetical protein SxD43FB_10605 [Sphingobium sp. D43FB]
MLRKFWTLLLVMIASSLVMTATVHAQERPGSLAIECSGTIHIDGDTDQSQGDSDKATPHHHGTCHGHSLSAPMTGESLVVAGASGMRSFPSSEGPTASYQGDPALRPPAA